jgi:hypothetical protein
MIIDEFSQANMEDLLEDQVGQEITLRFTEPGDVAQPEVYGRLVEVLPAVVRLKLPNGAECQVMVSSICSIETPEG